MALKKKAKEMQAARSMEPDLWLFHPSCEYSSKFHVQFPKSFGVHQIKLPLILLLYLSFHVVLPTNMV